MTAVQAAAHPTSHTGAIAGYRTFVAIVSVNYFTLIALSPRAWDAKPVPVWPVVAGLVGIRERAEQLGGTVHYRSAPGQGFTLDMELPAP